MSVIDEVFGEIDSMAKLSGKCLTFMSVNEAEDVPDEGWLYRLSSSDEELKKMFPDIYTEEEIEQITKENGMIKPLLMQFKIFSGTGELSQELRDEHRRIRESSSRH